jgi:hypothetical protein
MPNWKKVIVSGSNAVLNNVTASGDISASGNIFTTDISARGNISTTTISTLESGPLGTDAPTRVDLYNTSQYTGAIYDYILVDSTVGARTGQFMVVHDNGLLTFTDTSTKHLSDNIVPEISASFSSTDVEIYIVNGDGYTFKSFTKKL